MDQHDRIAEQYRSVCILYSRREIEVVWLPYKQRQRQPMTVSSLLRSPSLKIKTMPRFFKQRNTQIMLQCSDWPSISSDVAKTQQQRLQPRFRLFLTLLLQFSILPIYQKASTKRESWLEWDLNPRGFPLRIGYSRSNQLNSMPKHSALTTRPSSR